MSSRVLLAVGSYTEPVPHSPGAHGAGVVIIDLDLESGASRTLYEDASTRNPAFLCVHPTLPVLYVASEVYDGPGTVTSLEFTRDFAQLVARKVLPSGGTVPSYISVYDDCTLLLTNYADESLLDEFGPGSVASFSLGSDGHLVERRSLIPLRGNGPDPHRQVGPHGHCVVRHPVNGLAYATDLGSDRILQLRVEDGSLALVASTPVRAGSGPRHLVFTKGGEEALVVHELSSQLGVMAVAPDGSVVDGSYLSLLPEHGRVTSFGADLLVTQDGKRAYASNRLHDSLVTFERDRSGQWCVAGWTATGKVPRSIAMTSDERYLVVANQESNALTVFTTTATSGPRDPSGLSERFTTPVATPALVRILSTLPYNSGHYIR